MGPDERHNAATSAPSTNGGTTAFSSANDTASVIGHRGERRAGGHRQDRHHARGHDLHVQRRRLRLHRPERHPGDDFAAVKITTLPAAGTLTLNGVAVTAGEVVSVPTSPPASSSSRRRPTPTAPATPASPSRCRTTAARPTAASTSIRRANTMTINVTVGQRRAGGHEQDGHDARGHGLHLHARPTSASPIRTTARPTTCSAVKITTLPGAGTLTLNGVAGHRRASSSSVADITGGLLAVHAGGQRQRRRLRQLHLPGAGQRRHRQRRRRPRSDAPTR